MANARNAPYDPRLMSRDMRAMVTAAVARVHGEQGHQSGDEGEHEHQGGDKGEHGHQSGD